MHETTPIPEAELSYFLGAFEEALAHAQARRVEEGYAELAQGLSRAKSSQEPWAPELTARWETALLSYTRGWLHDARE